MTRVAWIGLGAMGARMAQRLVDADARLSVWNRTPGRVASLLAAGASAAETPAAAARDADVVFVAVTDPAALREVTEGADGVLAGLRRGAVIVDTSTVGPAAITHLAAQLPDGSEVVDAPVLGSIEEAAAGRLKLLVGASEDALARCRPLLAELGDVVYVGPTGSGAAAKLVANAALLGVVALLGETLALGGAAGLSAEACWQVLAHTPLAAQADRRRPVIEAGEYPPRFGLAMAAKDARLIVRAAQDGEVDAPVLNAVRGRLDDAVAAGLGDLDYLAVLRHVLTAGRRSGGGPK